MPISDHSYITFYALFDKAQDSEDPKKLALSSTLDIPKRFETGSSDVIYNGIDGFVLYSTHPLTPIKTAS